MCLKIFLVSVLVVSIGGLPVDIETATEFEFEIETDEPPVPFNAEQYKEYLSNLKCVDVIINHRGTKTAEVQSGTIYKPTTATESSEKWSASTEKHPKHDDGSEEKKVLDVSDYHEEEETKDSKEKKSKRSTGNFESTPSAPDVHSGGNSTSEGNKTEVCTAPLTEEWDKYDWYQILVDNGGAPGKTNVTGAKPNLTKANDPCARPLEFGSALQDKVWYINKTLQAEKRVYREEKASLRFPDTPHEFLDIRGLLVWSPPEEKHRSYHISYLKDDTGLYVSLDQEQRCRFTDPIHTFGIKCEDTGTIECTCENGREVCVDHNDEPISLSPGLVAGLVGK